MAQPPDLRIPPSTTAVRVRIIDTTSHLGGIPMSRLVYPVTKGYTELSCPAYAFLIEHPSKRNVLFDLGIRHDWKNLAPAVFNYVKNWEVTVKKGVREILEDEGVQGKDIEAVIWSHHHWDHIGDMSTFDPKTALIVGPGLKETFFPGYPAKSDSPILESDYAGRDVTELSFNQDLKIGNFPAVDYFGDGSFYLLDSPGHTVGHICGLARVTTSPDSFIFMGGDACHHSGEFRPSTYLPFPATITPHPLKPSTTTLCPGSLFEHLLPDGDKMKPFYGLRHPDGSSGAVDVEKAEQTIVKVQELDVDERILVVMAHDESLLDVLEFFPKYANGFVEKGWVRKGRWAFLKDFKGAVEAGALL